MKLRVLLTTLAAVAVMPVASAADSMRCGNRLVSDGDPKVKVAELCGQPTHSEQRTVYRSGVPRQRLRTDGLAIQSVSERELLIHNRSVVQVQVDVWVYNLGRTKLMREVIFEEGRVVEVNTLGRGY